MHGLDNFPTRQGKRGISRVILTLNRPVHGTGTSLHQSTSTAQLTGGMRT